MSSHEWVPLLSRDNLKKLTFRRIIIIITILLPFVFVVVESLLGRDWLLVALLSVIVAMLGTILADHYIVPTPYRKIRRKLSDAGNKAIEHPMLLQYYHDGIVRTEREMDNILTGKFNFTVLEVPEMSIHAMTLVDKKCILTFPIDQSVALLTPDFGPAYKYYHSMVGASKKMQASGLHGVTRIFILKKSEEMSTRLLAFISRNISDGINVRLIFEDDLPPRPAALDGLDFGYYETSQGEKWIMLLHRIESSERTDLVDYVVDTDQLRVQVYYDYSRELLRKSRTFDEFMKIMLKPINGELWPAYFAERGYEMLPPHGLSEEDADYIVSSALRRIENPSDASVLVLGFTPKLIKRLLEMKVGHIVSIDQTEVKPRDYGTSVSFETGNWLELASDRKFDAIVFDEAINNLSRIQLSLFFPRMAQFLTTHGSLIGRVMGRFDAEQMVKYANVSPGEAVQMLRRVSGKVHDDFAPLIICLLHSSNISFSIQTFLVDCERWNKVLNQLRSERHIGDQEFRDWKLQFDFKLLSPDQDTLLREARTSNFNLSEVRPVQGAYIGKWEDTRGFYKIYNFEYIVP
jgi:hypothetical protein